MESLALWALCFAVRALAHVVADSNDVQPKTIEELDVFPEFDYKMPIRRRDVSKDGDDEPLKDTGGACGAVWFRKEKGTGALVAIKVVTDEEELEHVMNEVYVLDLLKAENVPNVLNIRAKYRSEENDTVYIITDFINGDTIGGLLADKKFNYDEAHICEIFGQFLTTLAHFQKLKIIHRDIKADNLMITKDHKIKVIDFGFAEFLTEENDFQVNDYVGSPPTMAPEVLRLEPQDTAADRWSAFVVLIQMFERTEETLYEHICHDSCASRHDSDDAEIQEEIDALQYDMMTKSCLMTEKVPEPVQKLARQVFVLDPTKRPSLDVIMLDDWFADHNIHFPLLRRSTLLVTNAPRTRSAIKRRDKMNKQRRRNKKNKKKESKRKTSRKRRSRTSTARRQQRNDCGEDSPKSATKTRKTPTKTSSPRGKNATKRSSTTRSSTTRRSSRRHR